MSAEVRVSQAQSRASQSRVVARLERALGGPSQGLVHKEKISRETSLKKVEQGPAQVGSKPFSVTCVPWRLKTPLKSFSSSKVQLYAGARKRFQVKDGSGARRLLLGILFIYIGQCILESWKLLT